MAELNFYNLTVKYDGDALSKQAIKKRQKTENCMVSGIAILWFVAFVSCMQSSESNFIFSLVLITILSMAILYGIAPLCWVYITKDEPRYYDFIHSLMQLKENEIEVGYMNDRYVVKTYEAGWRYKEFGQFIPDDYLMNDKSDKSKIIHMTIDLTKDDIEVTVENK